MHNQLLLRDKLLATLVTLVQPRLDRQSYKNALLEIHSTARIQHTSFERVAGPSSECGTLPSVTTTHECVSDPLICATTAFAGSCTWVMQTKKNTMNKPSNTLLYSTL